MEVYVVTSGSYSDYMIEKVFTDRAKAEEYAAWLRDSNGVEVYETEDDLQVDKYYKVITRIRVHDNYSEDIQQVVDKTNQGTFNYNGYSDYHKYYGDYFELNITRTISKENWDNLGGSFWKNRFEKSLYDLVARVKDLRLQGFDEKEIRDIVGDWEKE